MKPLLFFDHDIPCKDWEEAASTLTRMKRKFNRSTGYLARRTVREGKHYVRIFKLQERK